MKSRNTISLKSAHFIKGAGSVFNLAGASLKKVKIGDMSDDLKALRNDWGLVGQAIGKAEQNHSGQCTKKLADDYGSTRPAR